LADIVCAESTLTGGGVGTMPLDDRNKRVGCLPSNLKDANLTGVMAVIDPDVMELGARILDEVWEPPMSKTDFDRSDMFVWESICLTQVSAG
jgi:hypothetical protein